MRYSKSTHAATDVRVTTRAPTPKNYSDTRNAGIKAINTLYMQLGMELPLCTCGEGDTIKF